MADAGKTEPKPLVTVTEGTEKTTTEKEANGKPPLAQHDSSILDLAFAMDCTGSMGSYIHKAQQSIRQIVEEIVSAEKSDIRLALVEYRDHPPQDRSFVTRVMDFTPSVSKMKKELDKCRADGGGDCPEAVADALHKVSKLSWRQEATKICVFISDAPPHGLGVNRDGFPKGCPDHHDPMEIAGILAQKNITMYMVGCEPAIVPYRDFFMSIAHLTGGQYVPLANAQLLAKVIIGGAQEEITLERLMRDMEAEVEQDVQAMGGWDCYEEHAEEINSRVMSRANARGFASKQLQMRGGALPEASSQAKKWAGYMNMSDIRKDYKEEAPRMAPMRASSMARPLHMMSSVSRGGAPKSKGFSMSRMFGRKNSGRSSETEPEVDMCEDTYDDLSEPTAYAMAAAPAPESMDDYNVAERNEIDEVQTKRMMQKFKNQRKM